MKIVIVGDGKVGDALAEQLSVEEHDVVIIDKNAETLKRASESLDVMCIRGNGASISVLKEANVSNSDIVIAATSRDEMNMVCSLTAKKLGAKYTIARIRDPDYAGDITLLKNELDIDMVINPEHATAVEISRLLRFPDATYIDTFYRGRVELVSFHALEGDPIVNMPLAQISKKNLSLDILFCAIDRDGEVIIPDGSFVIQKDDHVYVIGEMFGITKFFKRLGRITPKIKDVLIVGGGRIAHYLTNMLTEMGMNVKIIELDPNRCIELCESLPDTLVINGDGTDQEMLQSENISAADAFIAMTNRDEDNLMISLYALQCGVSKVVAKANRRTYTEVVKNLGLYSVVSPKFITASSIINLVRGMTNTHGGIMETMYQIVGGKAEALEFMVTKSTKNLGIPLRFIKFRPGVIIVTVIRNGRIIIPNGNVALEEGDNIILINKIDDDNMIYDLNDIFRDVGEPPHEL